MNSRLEAMTPKLDVATLRWAARYVFERSGYVDQGRAVTDALDAVGGGLNEVAARVERGEDPYPCGAADSKPQEEPKGEK